MFSQITCYQCSTCGSIFTTVPEHCTTCEQQGKLYEGQLVGAFKLLKRINANKWLVLCRICKQEKEIFTGNLRKQKSCGCMKDSLLQVINWQGNFITIRCRKCGLSADYEVELDLYVCKCCGAN